MTPLELVNRLKQSRAAATQGEWRPGYPVEQYTVYSGDTEIAVTANCEIFENGLSLELCKANNHFICEAANLTPKLCELLEPLLNYIEKIDTCDYENLFGATEHALKCRRCEILKTINAIAEGK